MMKYNIKWLLIGLFILLSGCSSEPMINLSEENQAKIEEKRMQSEEIVKESQVEGSISESQIESTINEAEQSVASSIDSNDWTRLPDETVLELSNYLPFYPYQLKQFNNATGMYTTYADYYDETNQKIQVREIVGTESYVSVYQWDDAQVQMTLRQEDIGLFENLLTANEQANDNVLTLLSAPLTVGTTWLYDGTHHSEILGLYETVTLNDETYTQVIETSTDFEDYELRQYYAEAEGLIGMRYVKGADWTEDEEYWQVTSNTHQVMMVVNQRIAQTQTAGETILALETVPMGYQTNDSMARAFQRLFTEQGWISQDITINSLIVDENRVATIDFSSGVVAAMNQHPSKENGVIPAIVTTIGDFLDVSEVRLTVNQNGLLPDTLPYPPNGMYQINPSWLAN